MTAIFPFTPNWKSPVNETLAFKTEIISSRSGREQRRAWRKSPRRQIEYGALLTESRYRAFKAFTQAHSREVVALPDPTRRVNITTAMTAGASAFSVEGTRAWLGAGSDIILSTNGRAELHKVLSVTGLNVVLETPTTYAWPTGAKVHPPIYGLVGEDLAGDSPTDTLFAPGVLFEITPTSEVGESVSVAGTTFNGREVVTQKPNRGRASNIVFSTPREQVDFGFGPVANTWPVPFRTRSWRGEFLAVSANAAQVLKATFIRACGCQGEFYMPTWEPDVLPKVTLTAGGTAVRIAGPEFAAAFTGSTVHKAVQIISPAGVPNYRTVSSVTTSSGDSFLNLSSAVAFDIKADTLISWLQVNRFESDQLTIEWVTDQVATLSFNVLTLEDLA